MKSFIQHSPPHPGELLYEFYLEPLQLSIKDAADKLDISRPNLSAIVNGRAGISAVMAMKLAKAFNTTPQYWLNMQVNFDLWVASQQEAPTIKKIRVLV
ncbi:MAG: HigA family addiction module antidote protein [Cytophagales bacterium]|nr:HigA family addiction module antidote protein [Cytophagales bacterium]